VVGEIPFSIPSKFFAGLANGDLIRYGTIIKEAGGGPIVAHLQETGVVQHLVNNAFNPLTTVSSIGANLQLSRLTSMVKTLQALQFASLGICLVGIGVSVVGFKIMNERMKELKSEILSLTEKVEYQFLELEARQFREHDSRITNLISEAGVASSYASPQSEWLRLAHAFSEEVGFYRGEVGHLLKLPRINLHGLRTLVELLTLCNTARIKCLIFANELAAAKTASLSASEQYSFLFDPVSPLSLAKRSMGSNSFQGYEGLLRFQLNESEPLIASVRDAQEASFTLPDLIDTLSNKGISGADFFARLEQEKNEPILCLEVS